MLILISVNNCLHMSTSSPLCLCNTLGVKKTGMDLLLCFTVIFEFEKMGGQKTLLPCDTNGEDRFRHSLC